MARFGMYAGAIVAGVVGLLILPAVFHALAPHDVEISGRFSAIAIVWLILGLILSGYLLTTRGSILGKADNAIRTRFSSLDSLAEDAPKPAVSTNFSAIASTTLIRLADLIYLLVIQAIVREPFVAVAKVFASEATVDGAYVGLVFIIAIGLLIGMRSVSRPLLDRLLWLGLNQIVPTAGYSAGKVESDGTRTSPSRQVAAVPTGQAPAVASKTSGSARSHADPSAEAATVVAPGDSPTVLAPDDLAATVVEAPPPGSEATIAEVAPANPVPIARVAFVDDENAVADKNGLDDVTRVADVVPSSDETIAPTGINRRAQNEGGL